MSYILDALRKSAEERRKHQIRKEQAYEPLSVDPRELQKKRLPVFLILLSLVSLACIAVAGGWFFVSVRNSVESNIHENSVTAQQPPATTVQEQDSARPRTEPAVRPNSVAPLAPERSRALVKDTSSATDQVSVVDPVINPKTPEPQAIPLLQDLPFAQQAAIPEMKFSGHVYSPDPDLRLVMVDTAIVREGEMITPDIKLVEIVDNGLILQYRQTRYKVELF